METTEHAMETAAMPADEELRARKRLRSEAMRLALGVGFLDTRQEVLAYAGAVYGAMLWAREAK